MFSVSGEAVCLCHQEEKICRCPLVFIPTYLHELNTKDITYLKAELNRIESFYPIELSFRYDTFPRNSLHIQHSTDFEQYGTNFFFCVCDFFWHMFDLSM